MTEPHFAKSVPKNFVQIEILDEQTVGCIVDGKLDIADIERWMARLRAKYGDYVKVELGPGRIAEEHRRPHITVGLNRSADYFCDIYMDLEWGMPFPDGSVDEIYSNQFLEHISRANKIHFMNEMWRVLKPGGFMEHDVPLEDGPHAYADPTHKDWYQEKSFDYYCMRGDGTSFVHRFSDYGIQCNFWMSKKEVFPKSHMIVLLAKLTPTQMANVLNGHQWAHR